MTSLAYFRAPSFLPQYPVVALTEPELQKQEPELMTAVEAVEISCLICPSP